MFNFSLLFIVSLAIFPYVINAECCGKTELKFERVDTSLTCQHFGGILSSDNVVIVHPFYRFPVGPYEKAGDCIIYACGDGKRPQDKKTYCGKGSCNIFGCNCDGGCIPGNALESFNALHGNKVRNVRR
ncbi:protein Diedel-like [Leptopilina heterotoma]|uniref:protein Diedel-like n=1 Tax=Leptopilina heterotoma TaxID=63436 RepID=UPI001CA82A9D|nr:protein Diedel-like [Leptopilina heterotoma]